MPRSQTGFASRVIALARVAQRINASAAQNFITSAVGIVYQNALSSPLGMAPQISAKM
jgi:hypothetical protein